MGSWPLHLLPVGRVQLISPFHSFQQHFDGRAQDARESPFPKPFSD
jgi:hypothetical protein